MKNINFMNIISEKRMNEIIDQILEENYYTSHLGNAQLQYKHQVTAKRNELRDQLINAVMQVIETNCPGADIKQQALALLLDPIVSKLYKWYKP